MLLERLEPRRLMTGVTLITHGFGGSAEAWVTAMGSAIAQQSGTLAQQPRYLMTVTDPGHDNGPLEVSSTRLGPPPAQWGSAEIIILLDWSDVAGSFPFGGYHRPTGVVGDAVAGKLLSSFSIPDIAQPLAQLPLHLIGHSRGASLVSEIARGLGQRGAWVDQLTFHDPHPVDGVREPSIFGIELDFEDAPMRVYDNVVFADNYWRTDGNTSSLDFTGESVNGAYNLQLSESVMTGTGYSVEHSDTHLFYHGTIGPPYPNSDGGASIGGNWYSAPHPSRDSTGFRYSRLGEGARPAAGQKFSGGHRDPVALTVSGGNVWDNIVINGFFDDVTITQGTPLTLNAAFEDRSIGGTRDATISLGFDRDDNPFNGVYNVLASVATSSLESDSLNAQLPTTDIAGGYRVFAKISNGTTSRYYYAPGRAVIHAAGFDKTWVGPAAGEWATAGNWSGAGLPTAADRVAIHDSLVSLSSSASMRHLQITGVAGALDLRDHDLVLDYTDPTPIAAIAAMIAGEKLRSSAAVPSIHALGLGEAANVLELATGESDLWSGQAVDDTSLLVKFTYAGDANLDGIVSGDDYSAIDFHIAVPGASGWFNGDFNYDGVISGDDYSAIDFAIIAQGAPL